jgi:hypothetical protein
MMKLNSDISVINTNTPPSPGKENTTSSVANARALFEGSDSGVKIKKPGPGEAASAEAVEALRAKAAKLAKKGHLHYPSYNIDNIAQYQEFMFSFGKELRGYPNVKSAIEDVNNYLSTHTSR